MVSFHGGANLLRAGHLGIGIADAREVIVRSRTIDDFDQVRESRTDQPTRDPTCDHRRDWHHADQTDGELVDW